MGSFLVNGVSSVKGEIFLPGDKSIAHRSVILSALTKDKTTIQNFPANADCISTINAFKKLGIKLTTSLKAGDSYTIDVYGKGLRGFKKPKSPIFIGDSGTTLRLLLGILAGQDFKVKLTAGKSLSKRPMLRVTAPLRLMGAKIKGQGTGHPVEAGHRSNSNKRRVLEEYPPLVIEGGNLKAISYRMPIASAQVKSAILLAGLYTKKTTVIIEPVKTRDHTERMLKLFKANIKVKGNKVFVRGNREPVSPKKVYIPGDFSSASFFIVLASILADSEIIIKNVNLNPTRLGAVKVLKRMGGNIKIANCKWQMANREPMGDILVRSSKLKGTVIKKEEIPSLIDELPVLMVAACCAKGESVFQSVGELRVKETDRINSMVQDLKKMGARIQITSGKLQGTRHPPLKRRRMSASALWRTQGTRGESLIINGGIALKGAAVESFGDHRTAMSMVVAGLRAQGATSIDDINCINKSFPGFISILKKII